MTDFSTRLAGRLARNAELARERAETEERLDLAELERAERDAADAAALRAEQAERHRTLVVHLAEVARGLAAASREDFVVRLGWSREGEAFVARIATRTLTPSRTLVLNLDRDDDQVLARWRSDLGEALELWHLLEVTPALLSELVLQVADQEAWAGATVPPAFPRPTP